MRPMAFLDPGPFEQIGPIQRCLWGSPDRDLTFLENNPDPDVARLKIGWMNGLTL
jgi:hypothetical protein